MSSIRAPTSIKSCHNQSGISLIVIFTALCGFFWSECTVSIRVDHTLYNNTVPSQDWAELSGLTPKRHVLKIYWKPRGVLCKCVCVWGFIKSEFPFSYFCPSHARFHYHAFPCPLCGHYLCPQWSLSLGRKTPGIAQWNTHTQVHFTHVQSCPSPSGQGLFYTAHTVWLN